MSASRKLRRSQQSQVLPGLSNKMTQVLEVGQHLSQVSAQIEEVNGKLTDLDSLLATLNHMQNLVRQSLEEGRVLHEELARQRYVNLRMHESLHPLTKEAVTKDEEGFRSDFDEMVRNSGETPSTEPPEEAVNGD